MRIVRKSAATHFAVLLAGTVWVAGAFASPDGMTVFESARKIPVHTNVDVLVVGGSVGAVAAAVAAAEAGARVFLAAPMTFLGEDMAGTLNLEAGGEPDTPLARRLFTAATPYAKFVYVASEPSRYPYNFVDPYEKLAEPTPLSSAADTLLFTNSSVTISCRFARPERITGVELRCVEYRKNHHPTGMEAVLKLSDGRTVKVTDFRERLAKEHYTEMMTVPWVRGPSGHEICYTAAADCEVVSAEVTVRAPADRSGIMLARVRFPKADWKEEREEPTPLKVKQILDRALIDAKVGFLTGMMATDLVEDGSGRCRGVVFANRSGRQAVLADRVIDATQFGTLGFLNNADGLAVPGGTLTLSRRVLSGIAPSSDGMTVEKTGKSVVIPHLTLDKTEKSACGQQLMAGFYDASCTYQMKRCTWTAFAAAECDLHGRTFVKSLADGAELVTAQGLADPLMPQGVDRLAWIPCAEAVRRGSQLGAEAAAKARDTKSAAKVRVRTGGVGKRIAEKGDVREKLDGIRPFEARQRMRVPSPARQLPVLGEYDVVVVGGGTSGAPAAIGASRGAKTLLIEYLHVLGGIHTESLVCGYYYGNQCGFACELNRRDWSVGATVRALGRPELFRRMVLENGGDVWYGTMGVGAYVEDGKVSGVVVATPFGRGVVKAKCVVDGTGNADVCAQAGAQTSFLDYREFVLMSAGFSPHRLGLSSFNTDLGYVNDSDVADAWLFGVRARAGAPASWDFSQLPATRERRRILSDRDVRPEDVLNGHRFPDTIVQPRSVFDSHRLTVADLCFLSGPRKNHIYDSNIPYRAVLPRGVSGVAAVGLGFGVDRDVLPVVRMQADLINLGYAVGTAAAMAAKNGGDYRKVSVEELQRKLVDEGGLRKEVLDWKGDDPMPDEAALSTAVKSLTGDGEGIALILENRKKSIPLLRRAYSSASGEGSRYVYAAVLGMLGDGTGFETLLAVVDGKMPEPKTYRRGSSYGSSVPELVIAEMALGRIRDRRATPALVKRLAGLDRKTPYSYVRGVTLALEDIADPAAATALEAKLDEKWVGRNVVTDATQLPGLGGYEVPPETEKCLVEIAFARALLASGDPNGTARAILESYCRDVRGFLALHASMILSDHDKGNSHTKEIK